MGPCSPMGVTALVTEHDKDPWPAASHTKQPPQDTKLCEATMLRAHLSKVSFAKAVEYLARRCSAGRAVCAMCALHTKQTTT